MWRKNMFIIINVTASNYTSPKMALMDTYETKESHHMRELGIEV